MGQKWHEIPIFHSSISPIFPEVEDSLVKNQLTALADGKIGIFATHQHSPLRQLVQMLLLGKVMPFLSWSGGGDRTGLLEPPPVAIETDFKCALSRIGILSMHILCTS